MNTLFFSLAPSNMASMAMYVPVRPTPALVLKQMIHQQMDLIYWHQHASVINPSNKAGFSTVF